MLRDYLRLQLKTIQEKAPKASRERAERRWVEKSAEIDGHNNKPIPMAD